MNANRMNANQMNANQKLFNSVTSEYASNELHPAEQKLLSLFKDRWHKMNVLDLGVGAGRTSYTFAPLSKEYIGVDYSEPMIGLCKQRIGETEAIRFVYGDAANLSFLKDKKFDLIIFSYNGIDYVDEEKRVQILEEVRHHLKTETGVFFFSSHCLWAYPFREKLPRFHLFHPVVYSYRFVNVLVRRFRLKWSNRAILPEVALSSGRAFLQDGVHNFGLVGYYTTPDYQTQQLKKAGFSHVDVWTMAGEPLRPDQRVNDPWLYYFCQ